MNYPYTLTKRLLLSQKILNEVISMWGKSREKVIEPIFEIIFFSGL